jgi:HD-like signal output (HDOD) protein
MANTARITPPPPPHPAEVVERVLRDIEKFPALLPVVQKALAVVENANGSSSQLERILQADPLMVVRILKLANSAYFGVMTEVRTVSMAVNIIGYRKLRSLLRHILVSGLVELLSHGRPGASGIRDTAVAASAAAYELAQRGQLEDPEEMLVAGQLFNIGELALFWSFPKEYEAVIAKSQTRPLNEVQKEAFGVDSLQLGRTVLDTWRFPAIFCEITARWPEPLSEPDAGLRRCLAIVHVAVALAATLASRGIAGQGTAAQGMAAEGNASALEFPPEMLAALGLPEEVPQQVLGVLPEKIAAVRAILAD